jgi:hypothetical protein
MAAVQRCGAKGNAHIRRLGALALFALVLGMGGCADQEVTEPDLSGTPESWVLHWNQIAVDASGLDHTPPDGGDRVWGEQLGPGRASRAMAIVHVAIFEALNAIVGGYESYLGLEPAAPAKAPGGPAPAVGSDDIALKAAVAQAAHDALVAVFPAQAEHFDEYLATDLAAMSAGSERDRGMDAGRRAAAAILARRNGDGSEHPEPRLGIEYIPGDDPGEWRQDPIGQHAIALGARWGEVQPFVLESASAYRVPPPPPLGSGAYAAAFDEAKSIGGDGKTTITVRSEEATTTGIYWAYDGTPSLCAPPRLYNQIAVLVAEQQGSGVVELARLLALVNVAMADAGIAIWESKYHYKFWRPVTGIREADAGMGPTGLGDGNPATVADPTFTPLGAPASNLSGPNFTPPFPAYPSGHAGFGGALFETLRRFYGTDAVSFTFVSDEFNGTTRDWEGIVRPLIPRMFASFSEAEEENGQSRIYLGIHWSFDKTEGIAQGRRVAERVFGALFRPRS